MSSIGHCDHDLRQVLLGNVVLTGGGSLFAGFADRLANEMSRQFPHVSPASSLLCGPFAAFGRTMNSPMGA